MVVKVIVLFLAIILVLSQSTATASSANSSSSSSSPLLNIKSVDCGCCGKDLTNIAHWFFLRSRVLILFILDTKDDTLRDFQNHFVREVSSLQHVPAVAVVYQNRNPGNKTKLLSSWTTFSGKAGVLMIGDSFETIRTFFGSLSKEENINRNCDFMFTVVSPGLSGGGLPTTTGDVYDAQVMGQFFRGLWKDFNILNSLVVDYRGCCSDGSVISASDLDVGFYDPFEYVGGFELDMDSDQNWGKFYWRTASTLREGDREFLTKRFVEDFRGYPLKVNQFYRYPTAIDRQYIPLGVQHSYVYNKLGRNGE